jgi:hypothetical protein
MTGREELEGVLFCRYDTLRCDRRSPGLLFVRDVDEGERLRSGTARHALRTAKPISGRPSAHMLHMNGLKTALPGGIPSNYDQTENIERLKREVATT